MKNRVTLALALLLSVPMSAPARAGAQSIALEFDRGRVTIHAFHVTAADILRRYSAVGNVEIVNVDVLPRNEITIALDRVPEDAALDILTRCCGGFLATRRADGAAVHASSFRRIVLAKTGASSSAAPAQVEPQPPAIEFIEPAPEPVEPAPGEIRPRLGPDGKPIPDDQEGAPAPPLQD